MNNPLIAYVADNTTIQTQNTVRLLVVGPGWYFAHFVSIEEN